MSFLSNNFLIILYSYDCMIVDTLIYNIVSFGNFNNFFLILYQQVTHSTNYGIKYF